MASPPRTDAASLQRQGLSLQACAGWAKLATQFVARLSKAAGAPKGNVTDGPVIRQGAINNSAQEIYSIGGYDLTSNNGLSQTISKECQPN